jgi:hypothetical protein
MILKRKYKEKDEIFLTYFRKKKRRKRKRKKTRRRKKIREKKLPMIWIQP